MRIQQSIIARSGRLQVIEITTTEFGRSSRRYRLERGPGLPDRRCESKAEAITLFRQIQKAEGGR